MADSTPNRCRELAPSVVNISEFHPAPQLIHLTRKQWRSVRKEIPKGRKLPKKGVFLAVHQLEKGGVMLEPTVAGKRRRKANAEFSYMWTENGIEIWVRFDPRGSPCRLFMTGGGRWTPKFFCVRGRCPGRCAVRIVRRRGRRYIYCQCR
ncbi:MAG: hypothetical protein JMN27_13600 [gamma proteobacterium endosymbiont of Lamellibrachia anaximandri]|nr:hypothetical protein [gamma proteobacterium endosymbiont of Lamellibrachia anaximandri]MBL3534850.1 hypothetical protein [gamma proteobacterium endosymbiont of Lamellibrachia anaximandri]MBL3598372.1 hypothetical protein [gamma proteobacterium endosymbiont of Lamellibrachia anaximandri]